jgi:hypothetical protein
LKGFILAVGHSGTTWSARALTAATDLVARHESWRYTIGNDFGGVESNGNLWKLTEELEERFGAPVIHQIRDGKKVVRTIMSRKRPDFFEAACRRWRARNERLATDICGNRRFRLEDLTSSFKVFRAMAEKLGATRVDKATWDSIRAVRVNASSAKALSTFPSWEDWSLEQRAIFADICGDHMKLFGYRL